MSITTVEPRFEGGPTLPEIAGVIAGIIALAIALAPTLADRGGAEGSNGAPAGQNLLRVEAAPPATATEWAGPAPGADLPGAGEGPTARSRCSMASPDGGVPAPGAYCPLPPRKQESKETHLVDLSFSWPRR
jgi:hypothetical protein